MDDNLAEVRRLLDEGSDPNSNLGNGNRPLHYARSAGIAEELIAKGADIDRSTRFDNSPLHAATSNGRILVAQVLIKHGANVHAKNENGYTPLHWAVSEMEDETAFYEPFCMDSPHSSIEMKDRLQIASILISNGADIDALTDHKQTPLHLAARSWESTDAVDLLINSGAATNIRDVGNYTPLWHAESSGHHKNAAVLRSAGGTK